MSINYNFDTTPCRLGSGSVKWDSSPVEGAIPMWVADMEFPAAPCIIEALKRRVDHGVFGYSYVGDDYYKALSGWFETRHGFSIDRSEVIYTPGVVPAISAVIKALVARDEGVIIQSPVYNCFFSSIRNNGCRVVENPLILRSADSHSFTFEIDFEDLEAKASDPANRMLLLCNPGNPAGRLWSIDELRRIAEICRRHNVTIVSDEIHCELTAPGTSYNPITTVAPEAIQLLSPSKAFNTAGLQIANIVCRDPEQRAAIDRAVNINEVCDVNPFGVEALKAAYTTEGAEWLDQLRAYLYDNYLTLCEMTAELMPGVKVSRLEATYLPMLDVRATRFGSDTAALEQLLLERGKVWVNSSEHYGACGFLRVNIACSREMMREGIRRIASVITSPV